MKWTVKSICACVEVESVRKPAIKPRKFNCLFNYVQPANSSTHSQELLLDSDAIHHDQIISANTTSNIISGLCH